MVKCEFFETCEKRIEWDNADKEKQKSGKWDSSASYWAQNRRYMCEENGGFPDHGDKCWVKSKLQLEALAVSSR